MESLFIRDFRLGLDTRRSELTQRPGTLEVLTNGFINQGGEIENRKAFVRTAQIANSFGLQTTSSGLLTFGSANNPGGYPLDIGPTTVNYQQLKHPQDLFDGTTNVVPMTEVVYSTEFRGKAWVVAKFGSSGSFGYYDGTLVYDFTNGYVYSFLNSNDEIATFIEQMIDRTGVYTATTASNVVTITGPVGQPFSISASETTAGSGTLTALKTSDPLNPSEAIGSVGGFRIIAGSASAGTNKISSVAINSVTITSAAVDWTGSNEQTAAAVAANINAYASTPDYTAVATGDLVSLYSADSVGDGANGYVVSVVAAGNVCVGKCVLQVIATTGFTSAVIYANGVDISGTVNYSTSPSGTASAIALAINTNTGTHGYLSIAKGALFYISKATSTSSDAPVPIEWTVVGGNSQNGIIDVETGGGASAGLLAILSVSSVIKLSSTFVITNWRFYLSVAFVGGTPPYSVTAWYGGTVTKVNSTSYYIDIQSLAQAPQPPPPHVSCDVKDASGTTVRSNTL